MNILLTLLLALSSQAHGNLPDIPPDASSSEYRPYLAANHLFSVADDGLDPVLRAGERNLAWLEFINSHLPENEKLSFTSKETQNGIPIDRPSEYSPGIILKDFGRLKSIYPTELAKIVFDGAPFTQNPPILTSEYLTWSRALDRAYQISARWRTMRGWLPILESRRSSDIRGYYFLSRMENREEKLKKFAAQSPEEQKNIRDWLISLCLNNYDSLSTCQGRIDQMITSQADLNAYYSQRERRSSELYRSFFTIPDHARRRDFSWANNRLITPFTDPEKEEVRHFMKFNVEDEWKWGEWKLEMPFSTERGHPYVVFQPGATPNVNGLGGDRITMNANQPLSEYDAQWTIRHEFGHVLGLPDCYVEFYAAEKQAIVNYQIDVDNIMCSRRGHVKQENVDELARVYGR